MAMIIISELSLINNNIINTDARQYIKDNGDLNDIMILSDGGTEEEELEDLLTRSNILYKVIYTGDKLTTLQNLFISDAIHSVIDSDESIAEFCAENNINYLNI